MNRLSPCVLIGWDGATWDLLLPWAKQGLLPNLAKLLDQGSARVLRSVIPPISPAAWVSIMTGMNPGKHGILDFKEFDAGDYVPMKATLINSTHFSGTTVLDVLSERGLRICSLQLPMTYPVWPINGLMLAGIPNPDDSKAYTYPTEYATDFEPLLPSLGRREMSYEELLAHETFHIRKLTEISCRLARDNFDIYFIYFRECDDFHHLYWRLLDESCPGYDPDEQARLGNPILAIYQELDQSLGQILAALPEANFFLISDHGGTAFGRRRFYLNGWLEQEGYVVRQRTVRGSLERAVFYAAQVIRPLIPLAMRINIQDSRPDLVRLWTKTRNSVHAVNWGKSGAFAVLMYFPTVGIQLNVQGRQPQGLITPGGEFEQLRDELIRKLKSLIDPATGCSVIREIYRREELFAGPCAQHIPDIVLRLDPDYVPRSELSSEVWGNTPASQFKELSGEHDLEGVFVAMGPAIQRGQFLSQASILDVAPTLLCSLAQAVPQNMDGKALEDIFESDFLKEHPPIVGGVRETTLRAGENVFSAQEAEAIRERLQDLGYLEE